MMMNSNSMRQKPTKSTSSAHSKLKRLIKLAGVFSLISLTGTGQASELWDNGDSGNSGGTVNNQYQSVLDDFYVPGAGWYVSSAETHGIFFSPGRVVSDVDVIIWPAEFGTGLPNGDTAFVLPTLSFEAVDTGENFEGYDKIKVAVEFDNKFLKGQEYYWIELDIRDQYGQRLRLLKTPESAHQNAHVRSNPYPYATAVDLDFRLFGTEVYTIYSGATDKFVLEGMDNSEKTVTLKIDGLKKHLAPGFYQIQLNQHTPVVYHFDQYGKHRLTFDARRNTTSKFHTPLGDEMCGKAPGSIQDFCQTFVACAGYGLFCPGL